MNSRNMKSPRSLLVPSMAVACGLITLSGAAYWAQQDDQSVVAPAPQDGERALVVTEVMNDQVQDHDAETDAPVRIVQHVASSNGDDDKSKHIEITDDNGNVTVIVNGKKIDASKIQREDGRITILDENGDPIDEIVMWSSDAFQNALTFENIDGELKEFIGQWRTNDATPFDVAYGLEIAPPKTMIGFLMEEPSEAICSHLHIHPDSSIIIKRVHEGLPAAKAGLKAHDIIVRIDGREPANGDALHKVLSEKSKGDTIRLEVIHRGERKQVDVELEAFDPGRMTLLETRGRDVFRFEDSPKMRTRTLFAPKITTSRDGTFTIEGNVENSQGMKEMQIFVTPDRATTVTPGNVQRFGVAPDGQSYQIVIDDVRRQIDDALKDIKVMVPDDFTVEFDTRVKKAIEKAHEDMGNTFEQHVREMEHAQHSEGFEQRLDEIQQRLDHVERLLRELVKDLKKN